MNLVVGSTGLLGGMITRRLLAQGSPVRVLSRSGTTAFPTAEAVRGDLKDRASLEAACQGATAVITTANSARRGGEDNVDSVDREGNLALIEAARAAGVRQFIFISAAHVDESSPVPLFAAKAAVEKALAASGLAWTVIAPHIFMDVWFPLIIGSALAAGQPVSLVGGGKSRHSFIAAEDVAAFTAASIDHDAALNQRLLLGGPDAVSWRELVDLASTIVGNPIPVMELEPGQPIPTLPPPIDRIIGEMAAGLERQDVVIDSFATSARFGVELTPAETVLRRMLARAM
jgi:uncharacterized protein YbjT (DUF2867 family)